VGAKPVGGEVFAVVRAVDRIGFLLVIEADDILFIDLVDVTNLYPLIAHGSALLFFGEWRVFQLNADC
jgi:hypothetical protein